MTTDSTHVVFGAGQVGHALIDQLVASGVSVRAVSHRRPATLSPQVDWRAADATDTEAAIDAAKGAAVIYQCLSAPYTEWPSRFPPLQRGVLAAAEQADALSDFFGAGVVESTPGKRVFANALAGTRADFIGNPDLAHTYSYVPDIASGLGTLGIDERSLGQIWHLPGPEAMSDSLTKGDLR